MYKTMLNRSEKMCYTINNMERGCWYAAVCYGSIVTLER